LDGVILRNNRSPFNYPPMYALPNEEVNLIEAANIETEDVPNYSKNVMVGVLRTVKYDI
jgi:hypothetical protein